MPQEIKYGAGSALCLDLPPEVVLADCTGSRGTPLDDPAAAVEAALRNPLDFPPVSLATVPGDRVTLVVDRAMPQVEAVVAGAARALLCGETPAGEVTIALPDDNEAAAVGKVASFLPRETRRQLRVVTHDPHDASGLFYLAASKRGRPVYLNRVLCDADLVLPIYTARLEASLGYIGIHSGLFPAFSNAETQRRFQSPAMDCQDRLRRRREEADEAAWLLGVRLAVHVVPGPGESVLHVVAGDVDSATTRSRELCEAAWLHHAPRQASLVVAAIEGGPQQQTWENVARALFAALHVVCDEGAIVLCTDVRRAPGPALQRLKAPHRRAAIDRDGLGGSATHDVSASLLAEALERANVYLLSGLDGGVVEDLGLGYIARAEDITRLTRQHDSCILLANAQHACFSLSAP